MKKSEMINDRLNQSDWLGEVVDITDPLEEGRVRVKVFGKFDKLENEQIPWASPSGFMMSAGSATGGGAFSLPKVGAIVNVQFENNNLYAPVYTYIQHISDELKEEITGDNYETAQSLIYDTDVEGGLKVFYTQEMGLVIKYNTKLMRMHEDGTLTITNKATDEYENDGNVIQIDPDGNLLIDMDTDLEVNIAGNSTVNITGDSEVNIDGDSTVNVGGDSTIDVGGKTTLTSGGKISIDSDAAIDITAGGGAITIDGTTKVKLGGSAATEPVVLGNIFNGIWSSHVHPGNLGYPTGPPVTPLKPALSNNVTAKM